MLEGLFALSTLNAPSRLMIIGILICLSYFIAGCWISYISLSLHYTIWLVLLFSSGFIGIQISVLLLLPIISKPTKRVLGILMGFNGAIGGIGWVMGVRMIYAFIFGVLLFFYFPLSSFQIENKESME